MTRTTLSEKGLQSRGVQCGRGSTAVGGSVRKLRKSHYQLQAEGGEREREKEGRREYREGGKEGGEVGGRTEIGQAYKLSKLILSDVILLTRVRLLKVP